MLSSFPFEFLPPVVAVLGSLVGLLFSIYSSKLGKSEGTSRRVMAYNAISEGGSADEKLHGDTRIADARIELRRQELSARWHSRSAVSLAISQYVVGGTLATSFIQKTLPELAVGFFGLIVLLASIIYQKFRPDLRASSARRRIAVLKAIIRRAEDGLFAIREGFPNAPTIQSIRAEVTNALIQVEHSELDETFLPLPSSIPKEAKTE